MLQPTNSGWFLTARLFTAERHVGQVTGHSTTVICPGHKVWLSLVVSDLHDHAGRPIISPTSLDRGFWEMLKVSLLT